MRIQLSLATCWLLIGLTCDTAFGQIADPFEPPPFEETAERPILGLQVGPLHTRNYRLLGISTQSGAIVEDVIPGSPAERYGVPRGAIIIGCNGMRIGHVQDLMAMMARVPVDRPVELTYLVGGRAYRQSIPLLEVEAPASGTVREEFAEKAPLKLPPPPDPQPATADPFAPAPVKPAPEGELRLPPAIDAAKVPADEDRVTALQAELDELRRRAAAIEKSLADLRSAE